MGITGPAERRVNVISVVSEHVVNITFQKENEQFGSKST